GLAENSAFNESNSRLASFNDSTTGVRLTVELVLSGAKQVNKATNSPDKGELKRE
ncbi:10221_t:CDS:1, partial [Acaulospora colombiana]